jgi:thiamine biosynthesis lipoprotein
VAVRADAVMGTVVTIDVHAEGAGDAVERAFGWFHHVETCCSRFDEGSELMRLSAQAGEPVVVSDLLFEAVRFALHIAEASGGAFDPTVGAAMMRRGFDREHRTGRRVRATPADAAMPEHDALPASSYRDVLLDQTRRTITLRRPLVLDLGAVAKGLAIDLAARELAPFRDFAVSAGGDLFLGGMNREGQPWTAGIRHPRQAGALIATLRVSNRAVCTSGDYERPAPAGAPGHHILDPRGGGSPSAAASVTVIAPTAMMADALATAALVLGPVEGIAFLQRMDAEGLIVGTDLVCHRTAGFAS